MKKVDKKTEETASKIGKKPNKSEIKEFDFGGENNNKAAKSMIKALTMTRRRLYPHRYDSKGRLKPEYAENKIVI